MPANSSNRREFLFLGSAGASPAGERALAFVNFDVRTRNRGEGAAICRRGACASQTSQILAHQELADFFLAEFEWLEKFSSERFRKNR